jgi:hypothetical protein
MPIWIKHVCLINVVLYLKTEKRDKSLKNLPLEKEGGQIASLRAANTAAAVFTF